MTRKDLERVYHLKRELKMWERRYNELIADISQDTPSADGMHHSVTNKINSPTEDKAIMIADQLDAIRGKKAELRMLIREIEVFICSIKDPIISQIIEYRCVQCMKWESVAERMGSSYTAENIRKTYSDYMRKEFTE